MSPAIFQTPGIDHWSSTQNIRVLYGVYKLTFIVDTTVKIAFVYYFLKEKMTFIFKDSVENDVIVYSIKERWFVSVTSFDQWKQRHLHINSDGSEIFLLIFLLKMVEKVITFKLFRQNVNIRNDSCFGAVHADWTCTRELANLPLNALWICQLSRARPICMNRTKIRFIP